MYLAIMPDLASEASKSRIKTMTGGQHRMFDDAAKHVERHDNVLYACLSAVSIPRFAKSLILAITVFGEYFQKVFGADNVLIMDPGVECKNFESKSWRDNVDKNMSQCESV